MKTMKKLVSLIMALAMVMALAVSATAATTTPSITIKNSGKDVTYNVYKLFSATYNETTGKIAYTGEVPSGLEAYFDKDASTGAITAKEGVDFAVGNSDLMGALKTWAGSATPVKANEKGVGGPLTITLSDFGYYVITSSLDGGAAVTLTSTNPTAEVNEKNDYKTPDVQNGDKTVDVSKDANVTNTTGNTVQNGQYAEYTIKFETVNYVNKVSDNTSKAQKVEKYIITDNLANGKLQDVKSISVKVGDRTLGANEYSYSNGIFTIDWLGVNGNSLYANGASIEIKYTAKVVSQSGAEAITNKFTVEYKLVDVENPEKVPTEPEVTVYTSAIVVNKVDEEGKALAGADFALKNSDGKYYKNEDGVVSWVDEQPAAKPADERTATTFTFSGLMDGDYTLVEIATPDGYNTINPEDNSLKVKIEAGTSATHATSVTKQIENQAGVELPETGGIGTTIFTVAGSVMMIGAAILYITKKRSEDCAN